MTREEFYEWLNTCPAANWAVRGDNYGEASVLFYYDEEDETEE